MKRPLVAYVHLNSLNISFRLKQWTSRRNESRHLLLHRLPDRMRLSTSELRDTMTRRFEQDHSFQGHMNFGKTCGFIFFSLA